MSFIKEIISLESLGEGLVVIDFHASWCGPCLNFAPTYEQAAQEFSGKMTFTKADVDAAPLLASTFGVRSIPTLVVLSNGQEISRASGAVPYQKLKQGLLHVLEHARHTAAHPGK